MKVHYKAALSAAVSAVVAFSGISAVNAHDFVLADVQPTAVVDLAGPTDGVFIVRLADPAVATYEGGIAGYEATSAKVTGDKKLKTNSKAAKKYQKRLKGKQKNVLDQASAKFGRTLNTKYDYQHAINGFAVALTVDEAKALGNMSGVVAVQRERMEYLLTDVGPAWIGAPAVWNNRRASSQGEGMVVAVLDTGVNSDHPSFSDVGGDGYNHTNPLGSGNYLPGSYCDVVDPSFCNDKLIGAWDMVASDGTIPEDNDGHGSHTMSTAAGNVVNGAELQVPTTTATFNVAGVAPHANVIHYDVCDDGCPGASLVAAINQVVVDSGNLPNGIASLNYSISGGGDPYNDAVELGFLAAVEAGIYVAASAGNSGPAASTVAHLGPWVSTTAASTHNRKIANDIINMSSDGPVLSDMSGSSFSTGYGPAAIIHANTIASDPAGQCLTPFPAGTFNGEIVMCDRGSIARTAKGQNVLAGGAGGYVLGNLGEGEGTVADGHFLPAIHLGDSSAAALRAWLAANTGTVATITPSAFNLDAANGDIMAGFSSRGPQLAFDVLKPDVTAPGVDIMAAEANGQAVSAPEYQIISGTSMSSPHNAGAGALLTATHPNWTPTEIKSALMMTSTTGNTFKEDGVTPTDPFDLGAGRIQLERANKAGLVLSESIANFLAADPETGGDPSTLNIASMMDSNCVGTCSWTRTVTNKTKKNGIWWISATGNGFDVEVDVNGRKSSNGAAIKVKIKKGRSATITVTVSNYASSTGWQFGQLDLKTNRGNGGRRNKPFLHMPIAVFASKASDATLFTKTVDSATAAAGDTLTYELNVTNGPLTGPITVNDVVPAGSTFVAGSETEVVSNGSTTSPWTYSAGTNSLSWTGELDPGGLEISPDGNIFGYFSLGAFGVAPFALPTNCDDGAQILNVPTYTYNGASYSSVIWSVNGTIEAGTASGSATSFANQDFPDATPPNNLLAPYWRDLNACAGGNMYVTVLSAGPYSWTVYEWEDVPHFGSTDAATFQVWVRNDGSPTDVPQAHFAYGRLDNTSVGATVGAENDAGTIGDAYFFNGAGTPPVVGTDLWVKTLNGGTATLGFKVTADYSSDLIVNEGTLSNSAANENAIAATICQ